MQALPLKPLKPLKPLPDKGICVDALIHNRIQRLFKTFTTMTHWQELSKEVTLYIYISVV